MSAYDPVHHGCRINHVMVKVIIITVASLTLFALYDRLMLSHIIFYDFFCVCGLSPLTLCLNFRFLLFILAFLLPDLSTSSAAYNFWVSLSTSLTCTVSEIFPLSQCKWLSIDTTLNIINLHVFWFLCKHMVCYFWGMEHRKVSNVWSDLQSTLGHWQAIQ